MEEEEMDKVIERLRKEEKDGRSGAAKDEKNESGLSDAKKAKSVKIQKKIYDQMLQQRILLQRPMEISQRFPQSKEYLNMLESEGKEIGKLLNKNRRQLKQHIKELQTIQKNLYDISKTEVKIKVAKVDEDDCDLDAIWKDLDTSFKKSLPFIEDTVSKWSNVNYNHLL